MLCYVGVHNIVQLAVGGLLLADGGRKIDLRLQAAGYPLPTASSWPIRIDNKRVALRDVFPAGIPLPSLQVETWEFCPFCRIKNLVH